MYGKSNMETYITKCKIDSQWELAVWLRTLKQGLCINLEWWDGEADGRGGSGRRGYTDSCGCFTLRFDRKQQNSAKQLSSIKINQKKY